jgi:hypothetical protein
MRESVFRSSTLVITLFSSAALTRPALAGDEVPPGAVAPIELRDELVGGRHGASIVRGVAFQDGHILDGARLYEVLRRDDLARSYRRRESTRTALTILGAVSVFGGVAVAAADKIHQECGVTQPANPFAPLETTCHEAGGGATFGLGISMAVLGAVSWIAGAAMDPEPVAPEERRRLVEGYNASLVHSSEAAGDRSAARFEGAVPVLRPDGASLLLRARF